MDTTLVTAPTLNIDNTITGGMRPLRLQGTCDASACNWTCQHIARYIGMKGLKTQEDMYVYVCIKHLAGWDEHIIDIKHLEWWDEKIIDIKHLECWDENIIDTKHFLIAGCDENIVDLKQLTKCDENTSALNT